MQTNRHRSNPRGAADGRGEGRGGRGGRGRGPRPCNRGSDCPYMLNDACAYAHTAADRVAAAAAGLARDSMALRVLERADRHVNLGLFDEALDIVCYLTVITLSGPEMHSRNHHDPRLAMARQDVAGGYGWNSDLRPPELLPVILPTHSVTAGPKPKPCMRVHEATNPWRPLGRWSSMTHHTFPATHRDGVRAV